MEKFISWSKLDIDIPSLPIIWCVNNEVLN
uniref:Uncharacterized protein n=1 Tax=Rhizophora mucronata TaxID=61149 RepID=A0A2P2Q8A5_RHIMU